MSFPDTHCLCKTESLESRFQIFSPGLHSIWIYPAREPPSLYPSPQMLLKWARAITALGSGFQSWNPGRSWIWGLHLEFSSRLSSKSSCVIKLTPMPLRLSWSCSESESAGTLLLRWPIMTQRGGDELQREGEGGSPGWASTSVLKAATVSSRQRRAAETFMLQREDSSFSVGAVGLWTGPSAPPVAWPAFYWNHPPRGWSRGSETGPGAASGAASSLVSAEAEC